MNRHRPMVGKRKWGYIKEVEKYLRVVVLEDGEDSTQCFF